MSSHDIVWPTRATFDCFRHHSSMLFMRITHISAQLLLHEVAEFLFALSRHSLDEAEAHLQKLEQR